MDCDFYRDIFFFQVSVVGACVWAEDMARRESVQRAGGWAAITGRDVTATSLGHNSCRVVRLFLSHQTPHRTGC